MNEHSPEQNEVQTPELEALIEKVRILAPYEGQPIDWLGSFVTNYKREDDIVSIYIPGLHGHVHEGDLFDDTIRIAVQKPLGSEGNHFLLSVKNYLIRLEYLEAEYHEDTEVYDSTTGKRATGIRGIDIERAQQTLDLQQLSGARTKLTRQKADELNDLLDNLDPSTKFFDES